MRKWWPLRRLLPAVACRRAGGADGGASHAVAVHRLRRRGLRLPLADLAPAHPTGQRPRRPRTGVDPTRDHRPRRGRTRRGIGARSSSARTTAKATERLREVKNANEPGRCMSGPGSLW